MATAFGQPVYDEPQKSDGGNGGGSPLDQEQPTFNIDDPAFTSEPLDVNVDADAYAQPVPPPDRKWRAKLKLLKQKDAATQGQEVDFVAAKWGSDNPQLVLVMHVQATIVDPSGKHDGLSAYDQTVSTFMQRTGGHKVQTFLRALRKPDGTPYVTAGTKMTPRAWADMLAKALAGEPEVGIESQWEAQCGECAQEAKKAGARRPKSINGMHHFPPSPKVRGEYDPELRCMANPAHGYYRARVRIAGVFPLAELK